MLRACSFAVVCVGLTLARPVRAPAQEPLVDGHVIRLWAGAAPGALGADSSDVPTLTVFLPWTMTPATPAMIVCPGGGYGMLADNHEGRQVANYLNSLGMVAFVLHYRLGPRYHHPVELGDAQRAIRLVRSRASEWGVDPKRIGIMGFSAGGHLAMSASTIFDAGDPRASDAIDRADSRPDFAVLAYPVITMTAAWVHEGSRRNLLGDNPNAESARRLSGELAVTKATPPTFIFHTSDDDAVPVENSLYYFLALRHAGVPAEMHIFEKGPHGVGLANDNDALSPWSVLLASWMRHNGFIR